MDITVERNAFGRQVNSFEADLDVPELKKTTGKQKPYHAIFIRAPIIESVTGTARVLATTSDKRIVAAQQGHLLATSFHPGADARHAFPRVLSIHRRLNRS